MDSYVERSLHRLSLRSVLALTLAFACGGASGTEEPSAETTAGAAEPETSNDAVPEETPPAEPPVPTPAHAVYLETSDADAAEALLLEYDEAGDNAHGYPPTGVAGNPAYPRTVAPGAIEGLDAHGVLVALAGDEAVAAALQEHLTARGYENVHTALVTATPDPLRALRVQGTPGREPTLHWVGGLRGSFARGRAEAGWMGTRGRATEEGVVLFVFGDLPSDRRLLKLEGGGSAEFPYECPIWMIELPEEAPVMAIERPIDTVDCIEH